jgi:hypothetical protein
VRQYGSPTATNPPGRTEGISAASVPGSPSQTKVAPRHSAASWRSFSRGERTGVGVHELDQGIQAGLGHGAAGRPVELLRLLDTRDVASETLSEQTGRSRLPGGDVQDV